MEIDVQPTNTIPVDTIDPETRNVRINGGRVGYLPNGDLVEVVQSEDEEGKPVEWPMLLRRNQKDILKAYNEYRDKRRWHLHQNRIYEMETGEEPLTEPQKADLEQSQKLLRRYERKYGTRNLRREDYYVLCGRMEALAWVLGAEWEEAGDT